MSENVVRLKLVEGCGNGTVVPVNRVLAAGRAAGLTDVVVIGYDADGALYAGSSHGASDTLWLLEQAKAWILAGCPAQDD